VWLQKLNRKYENYILRNIKMKSLIVVLVIAIVFVNLLGSSCRTTESDSGGDQKSHPTNHPAVHQTTKASKAVKEPDENDEQIPEQTEQFAEEILSDLSAAQVDERTDDLQKAFEHLKMICEKTEETRDAMLLTKFNTNAPTGINDSKGD
jgi:hypothetical protein